jgi:hypothetical protein
MDDRGANIDLVFRNGLKDYEVLPPPEVWDHVQPAIKVHPPRYIILKTAAAVAVLSTISFFAYKAGQDTIIFPEFSSVAMDVEAATPVFVRPSIPLSTAEIISTLPESFNAQSNLTADSEFTPVGNIIQTQSSDVSNIRMVNSLSSDKPSLQQGPPLINIAVFPVNSFIVEEAEQLYMPDVSSVKNTERWSIGALASPTYNSRVTTNKNDISKMLAASEHSLMSYSGGVAVAYKLNRRFTVQAGLYYSSLGQELEGIGTFSGFEQYDYTKGTNNFNVLTASGIVKANNADVFMIASGQVDRIQTVYTNDVFDPVKANLEIINNNLFQRFSFLELPVVLRYKFIDKDVDFNLVGGLSYNMLLTNAVFALTEGEKYYVGETTGMNPISVSSSLGMGMEYNFSEKLSFNIEPTLRYYINPFSSIGGSQSHPYSFGLFSGLSYKF